MDTPEKKQKTQKQETELGDNSKRSSKEKQKRIDEIARQMHPHDDEPDPTAYMGNYNFPQMLFAFCLGFATMFVLAVDEINDFKGCPLPEYFRENVK
jgi:hypothetical protein